MEKRIKDAFFKEGQRVPVVFIDIMDREAFSKDFVSGCVGMAAVRKMQRLLNQPSRENYLGEDSATLKHLFAAYAFLRHKAWNNAIILEDDATFEETVSGKSVWHDENGVFRTMLRDLPADYDIVMLSRYDPVDSLNTGKPRIGNHLVLAQQSRVASAYLISRKGATNLLRSLPVIGPPDFQINYMDPAARPAGQLDIPPLQNSGTLKIFHSVPWLSDQMDPTGTVRSLVQP